MSGLLRYARYQLTDFLAQRLSLPLLLLAFVAALPTYMMAKHSAPDFMQTQMGANLAKQMFAQSITLFLPIGAFVGSVGVMSTDRQQGYVRFLFSKPVGVVAYYAQAFALHAALFVALFGAVVWGFSRYTIHFSVHRSMEAAALTFLLIGGVGFLLGALTRLDSALLLVLYLAGLILQQLVATPNGLPNGGLPAWLAILARVLPPALPLDHVRDALYAGTAVDMGDFWHVALYGAGAGVLGLIALRRAPLAR